MSLSRTSSPQRDVVAREWGVTLTTTDAPAGLEVAELVRLALRRNPRRAHLLVSTVLGKHLGVHPGTVLATGRLLGELIARRLDGGPALSPDLQAAARSAVVGDDPEPLLRALDAPVPRPEPLLVLGFAETATGLGDFVAEQLGARWYLHSTRRAVPGVAVAGRFQEGHSHATDHLLLPHGPAVLDADVVVLVDDEISTGRTALGTIAELHRLRPRRRVVVGCLVDLRSAPDRAAFDDLGRQLGITIDTVAVATGRIVVPADLASVAAARLPRAAVTIAAQPVSAPVWLDLRWPAGVPDGGRHGMSADLHVFVSEAVAAVTAQLRGALPAASRILVLGTEEFIAVPARIAALLATEPGRDVRFQSTTRSPVHAWDRADYPVRRGFTFASPERSDDIPRYVYNVCWPDGTDPDLVVVVLDAAADRDATMAGLGAALTERGLPVLFVRLRSDPEPLTGPDFGSYSPAEVRWLLTDLSHLDLEGDVAQREQLIQSGQAHYAESLPQEFQPDPAYRRLFEEVLAESAERLARAVGLVTELVLSERGGASVVLTSLARAGTPVGILMRRWAGLFHGIDLPHYALSIVRGRGIDRVALNHLARHHDPASVVFVDGWTGKGAIARELTAALTDVVRTGGPRFSDDLAVLADPGACVRTFGTRDDFLIPSACLNSTVSGLISRTVLNPRFLRPDQFHGAKFYRELAGNNVSGHFLDAVAATFAAVQPTVLAELPVLASSDRTPSFAGWAAIEAIRAEYGITSVNFVKPGVGETTRVLLRRIPWRILVREADHPDHRHLRLLAVERRVPIEVRPDLPYSCVGLIRALSPDDRGEG